MAQLSSGQYRTGIGLRAFQQWSERSLRRPRLKEAAVALTEASLKTPDPAAFTAALVRFFRGLGLPPQFFLFSYGENLGAAQTPEKEKIFA